MRLRAVVKWVGIAVGSILGLAVIALVATYVVIGRDLDRTFDVAGTEVDVPTDAASIAEGARLARIRGCNDGCHGDGTRGQVFFTAPDGTRVIAPDLGRVALDYSNRDLERAIRHGVRPDGTSLILAMPSEMFHRLSDEDLGAIIAFLRSQPPGDEILPATRIGPLARAFFFQYRRMLGTILAAEYIDDDKEPPAAPFPNSVARGEYLAATICSECHGKDLRGAPDGFAPTLAIVAAYTPETFQTLMREGKPIGDRTLDLMTRVAERRFSYLTDDEIGNLYAYLNTLAASAPPPR